MNPAQVSVARADGGISLLFIAQAEGGRRWR